MLLFFVDMARRERTISGTEIVKADLGGADRSIDTNTPDLDIIWRLVNGANAGKVREAVGQGEGAREMEGGWRGEG